MVRKVTVKVWGYCKREHVRLRRLEWGSEAEGLRPRCRHHAEVTEAFDSLNRFS